MTSMVDINNVSKKFQEPHFALKNIQATINKGEIVGLVGPDGSGKTTLIRSIAALLQPTEGNITIEGKDTIKNAEEISLMIGYMPQKFGLYEDLTVQQNLDLYADLRGLLGKERQERYEKLLKFTDLARFTDRRAKALSGGMKQKLGLACALIKTPKLLLLDEPSVGVDPISRRELWKMVQQLLEEGITVVWSTSYLDEAERCDNILLLNEGKLLFHGNPKDLIQHVNDRVFKIRTTSGNRRELLATILKQENVLDAVILGSDIHFTLKSNTTINLPSNEKPQHATPRFEDAFVDILGGVSEKFSILAEKSPVFKTKEEIVVQADHLTKKFGNFTAANDITFSVKSGEIFGLLGPNGAGKSTTFKMMCGLLKPTEGAAYVNGLNLQEAPSKARSQIGYMAQKFSLYGNLSVRQNLEFFSGIYNLHGSVRREKIHEMIEIFNLEQYLEESAGQLPLGYKQRLALSCSVMHNPGILFLDEPTSGVDPITRREFWTHINGLVEKNVTVVVTTHFMDEAEYCDRIALVYRSKLIKMGTPEELKQSVKTENNPTPTLEDAFIDLVTDYEKRRQT